MSEIMFSWATIEQDFIACLFQKKAKNILRPSMLPKHPYVQMLYLIHNFGITAPFSLPICLTLFGSWRVQELRILATSQAVTGTSVPEAPPFHRIVLTTPHAGRGCCQTPGTLSSKPFALFPPMLWFFLCPAAARMIAQMWLWIALQERVQTENRSWSPPCKYLWMQYMLGLNVSQWCF